MAGGTVRARLRKDRDDDIRDGIAAKLAQGLDEADVVRAALRLYFAQEAPDLPAGSKPKATRAAAPRQKPQEGPPLMLFKAPAQHNPAAGSDAIDNLLGGY